MDSLQELKKNRKTTLESIKQDSEKLSKPQGQNFPKDTRFWYPTVDKAGNGYAIIRFLPAPKGESQPWARYYDHSFQGPTQKWYIEKSLTTIGAKDPVGEYNSKLWNAGDDASKDVARKQKRRENFVSNILVVNDPEHAEHNGKVFLFRYGKKLFENKIKSIMFPDEDLGQESGNPFDFWDGANFKLKIKQVAGFRNYDESAFANPSCISSKKSVDEQDADIETIWDLEYSLRPFTDPKEFKSYDELKARLEAVLSGEQAVPTRTAAQIEHDIDTATPRPTAIKPQVADDDDIDIEALLKDD